jgi:hypothetical protein
MLGNAEREFEITQLGIGGLCPVTVFSVMS